MENNTIVTMIRRRLPRYAERKLDWDFYWKSYQGGREYIEENLFQYYKEGNIEFRRRKERAYRENHCKRVIDLINSYLFAAPASRETSNALVGEFFNNIDGRGHDVNHFMKRVALFTSIFGRAYIVVDRPAIPAERRTGTAADNLSAPPYCWILTPQDMLDVAFTEEGKIKWALLRENIRDDDDPMTCTGEVKSQYRLWTPEEWVLYDDANNEIARETHGLGLVPIIPVDNEEGDEYDGQSLIGDIAFVDRAIFNNWSRLDTIINDQTFSQLIFPIEGLAFDELATSAELREKYMVLATNRILFYSAAAAVKPEFISPDASQADFILRTIERQIRQLYASMGMQAETATETTTQSGVAKAYDFDKLNKTLASKADNLEAAESALIEVFSAWQGVEVDVAIDYPDEFDVKSLADEIDMAGELALLDVSRRFKAEVDKGIVLKALPKAKQAVIKEIFNEIDAKADDDEEAQKKDVFPFDGNPEDAKDKDGDVDRGE